MPGYVFRDRRRSELRSKKEGGSCPVNPSAPFRRAPIDRVVTSTKSLSVTHQVAFKAILLSRSKFLYLSEENTHFGRFY